MVLFKSKILRPVLYYIHIYIPLWSYSNYNTVVDARDGVHNLHSTMVLFKSRLIIPFCCVFIFTFHYGPIQMMLTEPRFSRFFYLHSTMVLFKFEEKLGVHIVQDLHSTMVLFKLYMLYLH